MHYTDQDLLKFMAGNYPNEQELQTALAQDQKLRQRLQAIQEAYDLMDMAFPLTIEELTEQTTQYTQERAKSDTANAIVAEVDRLWQQGEPNPGKQRQFFQKTMNSLGLNRLQILRQKLGITRQQPDSTVQAAADDTQEQLLSRTWLPAREDSQMQIGLRQEEDNKLRIFFRDHQLLPIARGSFALGEKGQRREFVEGTAVFDQEELDLPVVVFLEDKRLTF